MLQSLRDHSRRWYVKALFVLLVISFCLWGVADIFLNYVNMRPVVTVNGHNITQEEFGARLQVMVGKAQELSKGQLSSDKIREMGIPQKILDSLIDQSLVAEELKKRHLVTTDTILRHTIQSIPAFLNEQGVFDRRAFDYILHTNHLTEGQFVADIRRDLQRQQLFGALFSGVQLPKSYVDLLFKGFFEQRVFAVVTIPFSKMIVKETPKEGDLEQYYKGNQAQFTLPEMRKVAILEMDPKRLKDQIAITQDKLLEEYQRRKAEFETAEKREIKQVNFKDEATATKAFEAIKKGRLVPEVAKENGGEFKDLGLVAKQQVPEAVADKLFGSQLGEAVGPVSTQSNWQVFLISKIEPSFTKSFADIRAVLEAELKTQLANDQIFELKNKVEDALAGGATLAELAKEHNFKIQTIEAISKSGKGPDEKSILADSGRAEVLDQIFSLAENSDSQVIDTKDGTSYVVHVDKITAAHVPPFQDIKEKVSKAWIENKRQELSLIMAQQIAKDVRSVSDLSRMALTRKLSIKMLDPLSRLDSETDEKIHKQFRPQLVSQMFELGSGRAIYGPTPELAGGGIQVVMLQKVLPFNEKPLKEKREQMDKKLSELAFSDANALYVKHLRSKAKISVNKSIYESIVNRGS